jgi:hypothetical protein
MSGSRNEALGILFQMSNVKKPNSNVSSNEPLKNGFLTNNKN